MLHRKHFKQLFLLVFLAVVAMMTVSCDSFQSNPTSPLSDDTSSMAKRWEYPAELFPGLKQEMWYFFNPDKTFHHYETFTYKYDASGRRISGEFFHSERGIGMTLSYTYDKKGKPIGEHWENPAVPGFWWDLTYTYKGSRIVGGTAKGGLYDFEYTYTFDAQGRRSSINMTSTSAFAAKFILHHQYNDQGRCLLSTGVDQENKDMLIVYTY